MKNLRSYYPIILAIVALMVIINFNIIWNFIYFIMPKKGCIVQERYDSNNKDVLIERIIRDSKGETIQYRKKSE